MKIWIAHPSPQPSPARGEGVKGESLSLGLIVALVTVEQGWYFLTAMRAWFLTWGAWARLVLGLMGPRGCTATMLVAACFRGRHPVSIYLGAIGVALELRIGGNAHVRVWLRADAGTRRGMRLGTRAGTRWRVRLRTRTLVAAAILTTAWALATALLTSGLIAAATLTGITCGLLRAPAAATALSAPTGNGLGFDVGVRLEARNNYFRNFALQHAFDVAQVIALIHAHQRQRFAFVTRAAGAADAVHVVFRNVR